MPWYKVYFRKSCSVDVWQALILCLQSPLNNTKEKFVINGSSITVPPHVNCKSRNVIYMWICKLCGEKETYFGRTIQESHKRTTGHRSCPCTLEMSIVWTFLWIYSTFQSWLRYPLSNSEEPSSNSLKNTILFRVDSTDTNAWAGFLTLTRLL